MEFLSSFHRPGHTAIEIVIVLTAAVGAAHFTHIIKWCWTGEIWKDDDP